MEKMMIQGGNLLRGTVDIKGAKNAVLPILAASVLTGSKCVFQNCPQLSDVFSALRIIENLGGTWTQDGDTITVDTTKATGTFVSEQSAKEMRSSIIFLGALAGRNKEANMFSPGGCELGPRPIDLHIKALEALGAEFTMEENILHCKAQRLTGTTVTLRFPSVGATENTLIAAVLAKGATVIKNAAKEPEIVDLIAFLNKCGADIEGGGTDTIIVKGVRELHGCTHRVAPDRIVTLTFMACVAVTGGDVTLRGTNWRDFQAALPLFTEAGVKVELEKDSIRVQSDGNLHCVKRVVTEPYPGFPTDAQPIAVAMMCFAKGKTEFVETIFSGRYKYIPELIKMGADIEVTDKQATVIGHSELIGNQVKCTDLRGGAAVVIAGLKAKGVTEISDLIHLDRGYAFMEKDLAKLGAVIKREKTENEKEVKQ